MIADQLDLLGPNLAEALTDRGFTELTRVQAAVLDPSLSDCDLRITSQTGSGKTVAVGILLRRAIEAYRDAEASSVGPCAMLVVPTRELAKQVHEELRWLYAKYGVRLACVTGGSNYRDERRALGARPAIVIGTPGRLVDHLQRGALDASAVSVIVLDEADRMLDLGFADELEAIFAAAPNRKHTHLVSATLAPYVLRLANRYQANPRHVQGTRPGEAHADIEHLVHLVPDNRRVDALVNVLLAEPEERTLVFVRTRADVTNVADELADAGFRVATLSGDMEQPARDRALLAFRQDKVRVLIATDVAARGIDIQGMTRVIHVEPPNDPDSYTHRSGRTGRAGQKGASIVFVAPERQQRLRALLAQARVSARVVPLPDVATLQAAADARTLKRLSDILGECKLDPRQRKLAEELLSQHEAVEVVAMLIENTQKGQDPAPRAIPDIAAALKNSRERRKQKREDERDGSPVNANRWTKAVPARANGAAQKTFGSNRPAPMYMPRDGQGSKFSSLPRRPEHHAGDREAGPGWGMFHVTWGQLQGADPRRMLAVVCRRGNIRGADVGAIRIGPTSTIIEIRNDVARDFAAQARKPDPEEPRIVITEMREGAQQRMAREPRSARGRA